MTADPPRRPPGATSVFGEAVGRASSLCWQHAAGEREGLWPRGQSRRWHQGQTCGLETRLVVPPGFLLEGATQKMQGGCECAGGREPDTAQQGPRAAEDWRDSRSSGLAPVAPEPVPGDSHGSLACGEQRLYCAAMTQVWGGRKHVLLSARGS